MKAAVVATAPAWAVGGPDGLYASDAMLRPS
jgi:hypothetical protein